MWHLCTSCLFACQVRHNVGDSNLRCWDHMTSFRCSLTPFVCCGLYVKLQYRDCFVLTRHKNESNEKERQRNKGRKKVCQVQHTSAILFWIGVPVKSRRFRQLKPSRIFQRALKKSHQSKLLRLFNCFSIYSLHTQWRNIHVIIYTGIHNRKKFFCPSRSKIHPSNIWLGPIKAFNRGSLVETVTIQNTFLLPHQVVKNIQATPGSAL